jgi:hypothetical protein
MKWIPAKLGAEPRKVAILAGLLLVAGYFMWSNLHTSGGESGASAPAVSAPSAQTADAGTAVGAGTARPGEPQRVTRRRGREDRGSVEDFRPSLKRARAIASDPTKVDPTLRVDLLARLQRVTFDGNMRSLFDYGQAPPPPVTEPKKIIPGQLRAGMVGPQPLPKPAPPPAPPPPPQIPLKFYGFVNPAKPSSKRAFFLEGEDIMVAGEGDTIHGRYKIMRIGVNSAVVEDTQFRNEQTLPLVAEDQG